MQQWKRGVFKKPATFLWKNAAKKKKKKEKRKKKAYNS